MVTIQQMAEGYIEHVRMELESTRNQLTELQERVKQLEAHLQECSSAILDKPKVNPLA